MLELCNKCKWKDIPEPNKCQTCKHNMITKQDYYEKNDREAKAKIKKAVRTEGQTYEEHIKECSSCETTNPSKPKAI